MKIAKLAALAALLTIGVPRADANQTNVVQNVGIYLNGVQPGGTTGNRFEVTAGIAPARIDTRSVIQALGKATGNTFANTARLVVVTPVGGGESSIQVRDGAVIVDVTALFVHQQLSDSVSGTVSNIVTRRTTSLVYSIQRLALQDNGGVTLGLHFDVNGVATENSINGVPGVSELQLDVSGAGDVNGALQILSGFIEIRGAKLEVVSGGGIT